MPAEKKKQADWFQWGLGPAIGIIVFFMTFTEGYQRLELVSYDTRFNLRNSFFGPPAMDPRLGTIDIDDFSVENEGRYNDWGRDKYADVIRILSEYGASMVAFDVFFTEESPRLVSEAQIRAMGEINSAKMETLLGQVDYDALFLKTIAAAGNVYLAQYTKNSTQPDPMDEEMLEALKVVRRNSPKLMVPVDQSTIAPINEFEPPLSLFRQAARGFAFAQSVPDVDGLRRRYPLVYQYGDVLFPALALVMACDHFGVSITEVEVWPGRHIRIPGASLPDGQIQDVDIPIDERGTMYVNWAGRWRDTFQHYPHFGLRLAAKREQRQQVLMKVKEMVAADPQLMRRPTNLLQALGALGYNDAGIIKKVFITYMQAKSIEAALVSRPELTAPDFWRGIGKQESSEKEQDLFNDIRLTNRVADLLLADSGRSVESLRAELGGDSLKVAQSAYHVRSLLVDGQLPQAARPLFFYPYIEYHNGSHEDILTRDAIKDKILVYGLTATGSHDLSVTPFQGDYPMVGIYPNVINTILNRIFIYHAPHWVDALLAVVVGVFLSFTVPRMSIRKGLLVVLGSGLIYTLIAFLAFSQAGYWFELVGPLSTLTLGYLSLTIYGYVASEKEKRFVQGAFGHYLSPAVVDQIMENPDMVNQLGGEERVMTAFFSDVASFSTISERLTPAELVSFINEYLSEMCDIIEYYGGTIDKFEGDAIVAFFGAPVFYEDHAIRGVMACIDQQKKMVEMRQHWAKKGNIPVKLEELRQSWAAEGQTFAQVRIGLAAGPMVVGNMGSRTRNDYTMMGDTVNLAARFESGQKFYGTDVMINDLIYEQVKDLVESRLLDKIQVMGKELPVAAYQVLDRKGELDDKKMEVLGLYNQGIERYLLFEADRDARHFSDAIPFFRQALELDPTDGPSELYLDRCEDFANDPPPDLVFRATSK
jgi:class 3 adenylate cyclase